MGYVQFGSIEIYFIEEHLAGLLLNDFINDFDLEVIGLGNLRNSPQAAVIADWIFLM